MLTFKLLKECSVRFSESFCFVTIEGIKELLSIQDDLEDDLKDALDHLIDHEWDRINLPEDCTKEQINTYIAHFNACIDPILSDSFDAYENLVISGFEAEVLPFIIENMESDGIKDIPARREAFNNYSDSLCKEGVIPERVYNEICLPDRFEK